MSFPVPPSLLIFYFTDKVANLLQKTASGLFLPSASNQIPPPEALVVAVGPGVHRDGALVPVSVKAGDRVVLPGFGGVPIKVGEEVSRCVFILLGAFVIFFGWRM